MALTKMKNVMGDFLKTFPFPVKNEVRHLRPSLSQTKASNFMLSK